MTPPVSRYDVQAKPPVLALQTGAPLRVLLLDDCAFDRSRILRLMRHSGLHAEVTEVTTVDDLKQSVAARAFDVFILDWRLSGGDTRAAPDYIMGSATSRRAGMILVSGWQQESAESILSTSGCDCFLHKSDLSPTSLFCTVLEARIAGLARPVHVALKSRAS